MNTSDLGQCDVISAIFQNSISFLVSFLPFFPIKHDFKSYKAHLISSHLISSHFTLSERTLTKFDQR